VAFIRTVRPRNATGALREAYDYLSRVTGNGPTPHIIEVFSLKPASTRAAVRMWELSMWMGKEPRKHREFLAAATSRVLNCSY
jgi:hypothetical protein